MLTQITSLSQAIELIKALEQRVEQAEQQVMQAEEQLQQKDQIIAQLKERLNKNSSNSSKPPTSDGLKRSAIIESQLKTRTKKKQGGQKGHPGNTLKQVENPDVIITHQADCCQNCGTDISGQPVEHTIKRQVLDLKIVQEVTEHQGQVKKCTNCGHKTIPAFPQEAEANVQYGVNFKSLALYLQQQFVPYHRLSKLLEAVSGYRVSVGSLQTWSRQLSRGLDQWYQDLFTHVSSAQESVKCLDETGMRVRGSTSWFHVLSNVYYTYYHYGPNRGKLLPNLKGWVVHDHWKSYFKLDQVRGHVGCNAHILRELKGVMDNDEKAVWARGLHRLLSLVCHWSKSVVSWRKLRRLSCLYDNLLSLGLSYYENLPLISLPTIGKTKRRPGHNLVLRLAKYKKEHLRCLYIPGVPATNNQAERDIRMVKVHQKVSGSHRTVLGVEDFAKIRSFISTLGKQSLDILPNLQAALTRQVHFQPLKA